MKPIQIFVISFWAACLNGCPLDCRFDASFGDNGETAVTATGAVGETDVTATAVGDEISSMASEAPTEGTVQGTETTSTPTCGDNNKDIDEECDDGNLDDADACLSSCLKAKCGDGTLWVTIEQCDDGNANPFDGCEPNCEVTRILSIVAGDHRTGVISNGGGVKNWGLGKFGLGYGNVQTVGDQPFEMPPENVEIGGLADILEMGAYYSCARMRDSASLRCWGHGQSGPLGYGNNETVGDGPGEMPPMDVNLGGKVSQFSLGSSFGCALMAGTGAVRCWGSNFSSELGNEKSDKDDIGDEIGEMPPPDVELSGKVHSLAVGGEHTCVLLEQGFVQCWGQNIWGQVGIESDDDSIGDSPGSMPPPLVKYGALDEKVLQIAAGGRHSCVLLEDRKVRCWGYGIKGTLGQGTTENLGDGPGDMPPPDVPLGGSVSRLALGHDFSCAIMESADIRCWGDGDNGRLGYGNTEDVGDEPGEMPPKNVNIGGKAVDIALGLAHACALLDNGTVKCWGRGEFGALGYGSVYDRISMPPDPVDVF